MKQATLRLVLVAAMSATTVATVTGCAMARHQSSVGDVIDDSTITTKIKAKYAGDRAVSAMAINVDTLKGVVQLSGFAKNAEEKAMAEALARDTKGVVDVRNNIVVR